MKRTNSIWWVAGLGLLGCFSMPAFGFEAPPVLSARESRPKDIPIRGADYRIDEQVPTDGFLATYTIRTDYGTIQARGPGVLRTRMDELKAIAALAEIRKSDVFVDSLKRSGNAIGGAIANVATNTAEVVQAVPASLGRFFKRTGRQLATAAQKIGDVHEGRDTGAAKGAEESTNEVNTVVAGGVASGKAVRDMLGYDEQRRQLAKSLGVDPYTLNPILKKKLDDVSWAGFAGGLGVNMMISHIPGGRLIQATSALDEMIYEKSPGDVKVWMQVELEGMGVGAETIDLFLRLNFFTLSMQSALVSALNRMSDVEGRAAVMEFAVTLDAVDEARYLSASMEMLARVHAAVPLRKILRGRPVGLTQRGGIVVCSAADYLSWNEQLADFVDHAGVKQDPLSERRLTGIDVRSNPNVPSPLKRKRTIRIVGCRRHRRKRLSAQENSDHQRK